MARVAISGARVFDGKQQRSGFGPRSTTISAGPHGTSMAKRSSHWKNGPPCRPCARRRPGHDVAPRPEHVNARLEGDARRPGHGLVLRGSASVAPASTTSQRFWPRPQFARVRPRDQRECACLRTRGAARGESRLRDRGPRHRRRSPSCGRRVRPRGYDVGSSSSPKWRLKRAPAACTQTGRPAFLNASRRPV